MKTKIESETLAQGAEVLNVKQLFAAQFLKAANGVTENEQFFCRPDCVAELWRTITDDMFSVFNEPIARWLQNSMIELLLHPSCIFEWNNRIGYFPLITDFDDHLKSIEEAKKTYNYNDDAGDTDQLSIKQIAQIIHEMPYPRRICWGQIMETDYMKLVKILMFRLYIIHCEDYYKQGWLEDRATDEWDEEQDDIFYELNPTYSRPEKLVAKI